MNRPTDSKTNMRSVEERLSQNLLLKTECVINKNTDEELVCWGYTYSAWRKVLFWVAVVLTLGLLLLVVNWKPELECYLQRQRCALHKAHFLLIKTRFGLMSVIQIQTIKGPIDGEHLSSYTSTGSGGAAVVPDSSVHDGVITTDDRAQLTSSWQEEEFSDEISGVGGACGPGEESARYFDFQKTRYVWDQVRGSFRKLEDLSSGTTCLTIHEQFQGMSDEQRMARLRLYGFNSMEIEVPSYWNLFIDEVLNPFYIFQIASIILWSLDSYYYYAACIFLISAISITISLRETKKVRSNYLFHNGRTYIEKPEHDLVPGDLIAIPPNGCVMTCDAVLTAGTCIVNESMLTGESVPVTKTPLLQSEDQEIYAPEQHKRHTLFSGTHIVQTRYYGQAKVTAVVVRTGFNTAKGELVRAILFPKPLDFKFYQDAIRFILFLSVVASIGMTYSCIHYIINNEPAGKTILRVLDIVTVVVPPALPAAMTVGTVYAQNRLKKSKIFCISPPRINFCGRINVFCFDKTGTLTEDGLDMWGVVPVEDTHFRHPIPNPATLQRGPLIVCLATCHSLTIIDGELSGDPLDLIMFNAINWYLEEPGADTHKYDTIMPTVVKPCSSETFLGEEHPFEVGIIRQFTFSSSAQRMSVITRTMGEDHMDIHCKGAPEKVASLCRPESVPHDFHSVLHSYSIQGFRVIALAHRPMDPKITWHQVQRISRDKVEKDLTFLGLLVLQNQLKPQTAPVIRTLKAANIRSVMITGDMLQTAVSVARNCSMVGPKERVILVHAHQPDLSKGQQSASIEWEEAEHGVDEEDASNSATEVDTDHENQPLLSDDGDTLAVSDPRNPRNQRYTSLNMDLDIPHRKHLAINGKSYQVICNHFPDLLPKECLACQSSKIKAHVRSPVVKIPVPEKRFSHIHIDLVGPLPPSEGFTYLLTIIDRSSRWPEAVPITNTSASVCAKALIRHWIARLGVPLDMTSDRGSQFTSALWTEMANQLGIQLHRTSAYHPQSNGLVERFHRTLKAALKTKLKGPNWADELPWVLLGLRTVPKEDLQVSCSELVYGEPLTLPGQFVDPNPTAFSTKFDPFRSLVKRLIPLPMTHHCTPKTTDQQSLKDARFVFIRRDGHRGPLQRPYDGLFQVISAGDKTFRIMVGGREEVISIDRLKQANVDLSGPVKLALPPRRGLRNHIHEQPNNVHRHPRLDRSSVDLHASCDWNASAGGSCVAACVRLHIYTVGMCGDGANDCEALKAAHAGISLSEAEASVAAPFTSSVNNIECVVTAVRYSRIF
ncbi:cation-transporting ATPase [Elysia marginata]|uniref:Cation-transporting ATPase n=1 Tax=Elysia marginata TaxID=1093978 RepID=A0AAV4I6G7_9GAST|nr:cation-transporting ATPase [Elysia marginata]